ncbi:AAA family ATPase [uncultured Rhodoblastus sp.]|uniref:AAA family ATPase n=1 Tax=uncultured Rhodoblastus sp. TaxID=543037 RepID=UPI0025ED8B1D|nr:AAA family ATPase [uncultured Rhodoblastus sp.]
MITRLAISGYRSLRNVLLELSQLNVVCGGNGVGKSSLYRSIRLLADCAQGRAVRSLALEGGLQSTLWAGPEVFSRGMKQGSIPVQGVVRKTPVSLRLGFSSDLWGYAIDLGLPTPDGRSMFNADPQIKAEAMWTGEKLTRASQFAHRRGPSVRLRDPAGAWRQAYTQLAGFDSMMTHCADPSDALDLLLLREHMRAWRFYDHFRTDAEAPARRPQVGTHTPILASDGADLAAAIQTICEVGRGDWLAEAVEDAFPGSKLGVETERGLFALTMFQRGLLRPLQAAELSDGTLRYLLLVAALLTPRPPQLMVLNEPETSLHPDLLPSLARLIAQAARETQFIVVTHSPALTRALLSGAAAREIRLEKELGETIVRDQDAAPWHWPER